MTVDQSQRELFERQLKTCRHDLSWGERGKYPLEVLFHGAEAYPLFDDKHWGAKYEFVWFCQHTGRGAFRGRFEAINDLASLSDEARYISRQARTFCSNSNCSATSVAGLSSSKCPRCGKEDGIILFSLKMDGEPTEGRTPIDLPQDFRGEGLAIGRLQLVWNLWGALVLGVVLAGLSREESEEPWGLAIMYMLVIIAIGYTVRRYRAKVRGGITVTREGLSFRRRNSSPAETFSFKDIAVLHAQYNVIRGALFFVMRRDFNIFLYVIDGSRLFSHTNERFTSDQAVAFLQSVARANSELMIFAPLLMA